MELRPGYKQTEVGAIPDEWESTTVSAVAAPVRNAIVGGPFGSDLVSQDYVDDGVPVIRGQNLGSRWIEGPFVFVTARKAESLAANLARPGDIVFTQRGTLGQVSLVPASPYERYLVSQSQMKVTLNRNLIDPAFFHCLFSGAFEQAQIRRSTIQTGVPHINLGILRDIPLPRPPLPEQRAISRALGDVDLMLSALTRLIAKKRDLKQATTQQLLTGRFRLPGFRENWEVKTLGAVLNYEQPTRYLVRSSDYSDNYGVAVLTANKSFLLGFTDEHDGVCETVPVIIFDDFTTASKYVGFPFKVKSSALKILRLRDSRDDLRFLFRCMQMIRFSQGDHKRYWISEYQHIAIGIPAAAEQSAIAGVLSDMDGEIAALEGYRAKVRELKQAMMQDLLIGRTRLV